MFPTGIADVLRHYSHVGECLATEPPPTRGFSGAVILRVTTTGGDFCLRGEPSDSLPAPRIRGLHRYLRYLEAEGVDCIAVPVQSDKGESLIEVRGRLWQLEPWLPGVADFHRQPSPERLSSAMRSLAALHVRAAGYRCPREDETWFAVRRGPSGSIAERLRLVARWERRIVGGLRPASDWSPAACELWDSFVESTERLRAELQTDAETSLGLHPCIRDLWHDHLLFIGDRLSGLIDLSATRTECVATDLSRLLGSLLGDNLSRWNFALDEYSTIRPLSDAERRLISAFDRSGVLLSGLTWVRRLYIDRDRHLDRERALKRLESFAARSQFFGTPQ